MRMNCNAEKYTLITKMITAYINLLKPSGFFTYHKV